MRVEGFTGLKQRVFRQETDHTMGTKRIRHAACVYQYLMVPKTRVFRALPPDTGRVEGHGLETACVGAVMCLKRCVFWQETDQKTGTKHSRRTACVWQHFMVPKTRVFRAVTAGIGRFEGVGRVKGVTCLQLDVLRVSRA